MFDTAHTLLSQPQPLPRESVYTEYLKHKESMKDSKRRKEESEKNKKKATHNDLGSLFNPTLRFEDLPD